LPGGFDSKLADFYIPPGPPFCLIRKNTAKNTPRGNPVCLVFLPGQNTAGRAQQRPAKPQQAKKSKKTKITKNTKILSFL